MRLRYATCLLTLWMAGFAPRLAAQEPPTPSSPDSAPLTESEKRDAVLFIEKFALQVEAERLLRESLKRQEDFAEKERALAARELDTEKQRTALTEKEVSIQKDRADFYKTAFENATKGRTLGCKVLKVFTLGLAKCA